MDSAVFPNQNDLNWDPMGKIAYSSPRVNGNPNPSSKKKQKRYREPVENSGRHMHNSNVDSPVVTLTASDDAYSINQPWSSNSGFNCGGHVTFKVSTYTKSELIKLRKRLLTDLDHVRDLRSRIEMGTLEFSGSTKSKVKSEKVSGNVRHVAPATKKLSNGIENGFSGDTISIEALMKECSKIVSKLIKHKHGYIFRVPVDAAALGLHDYHMIVKQPMDLGTVKTNLARYLYANPMEFAADVRLTFNNAVLYNPKHDPVHGMAVQMLSRFEELFKPIQEKLDSLRRDDFHEQGDIDELQHFRAIEDERQGSSMKMMKKNSNQVVSSMLNRKKVKPKSTPVDQAFKKLDWIPTAVQSHSTASTPSNPPHLPVNPQQQPSTPPRRRSSPVKEQKVGRGAKLPKPKAKDPNKREMSMEEKQKLGYGLQGLPQEKMPQLVQIIRKRNEHLAQDGDEIELDIEALDTETLWELDRFVTNWKKFVSKTKRQALMMNYNAEVKSAPQPSEDDAVLDEKIDTAAEVKEKEDEDVDIDDVQETSLPPVDIEKDEGSSGRVEGQDRVQSSRGASSSNTSSGSSSSGSSSSTGSDSGSSSGSESGDDAHS